MKRHFIIPIFVNHQGCAYRCMYCNQDKITGGEAHLPQDVPVIIERHLKTIPSSAYREVAFYGGSFTALPLPNMINYLDQVQPYLAHNQVGNIRISTRPDAISPEILSLLRSYGVTVIELGVQSMNEEVLRRSGRPYSPETVAEASRLIKEMGFLLGHQIMLGLPGSNYEIEMETARRVIALQPEMIRIYPTLILKGTPLARLYADNKYQPLSLEEAVKIGTDMLTLFEKAGIKVLRMGLQDTRQFHEEDIVGGPYHPSFGELVESELFRRQAEALIRDYQANSPADEIRLYVNRRDVSKMKGHYRTNIGDLKDRFKLLALAVITSKDIDLGTVGIGDGESDSPQMLLSRADYCNRVQDACQEIHGRRSISGSFKGVGQFQP